MLVGPVHCTAVVCVVETHSWAHNGYKVSRIKKKEKKRKKERKRERKKGKREGKRKSERGEKL